MTSDINVLRNWKLVDLIFVLNSSGRIVAKRDPLFKPVKSPTSCRFLVGVPGGRDFHIILTGQKWFDSLSGTGGGGAIDLVMFLFDMRYRPALAFLKSLDQP